MGTPGFVVKTIGEKRRLRKKPRTRSPVTMRAWPVARSIFDAPLVREANERTTSWISSPVTTLSVAGAPDGCRFAAAGPNK